MQDLNELRAQIDALDDQILYLLDKRMSYVKEIGKIKQSNAQEIYDHKREEYILDRLNNVKYKFLNSNMIKSIYREIFFISKQIQNLD
ncbi:chorismate mutase [Campylobacter novaezeelandiae]|uniref:chorismate mutase n=1 Tax=Campylobacter novaezeelandiae TaxID=2267891 RepID=A0A4Q9JWZ5_9BACT|nr:chorismate mutase [Campylobacter novaezeelandiae]QWU80655.1 chorismate mutase, type II [Campylobacter novaezeelandiae]TBR78368.1 chorismate mutase [Campylobacter novaezeelandiae]TBR79706.1 chorismate mutase [Campylobacter novaezeelandiae]TBR80320.1 chorismate mutase [Campylobacter novaezeelandiae]TBR80655.1 chorismate mutase [Campylobacter novaezeelandiae]